MAAWWSSPEAVGAVANWAQGIGVILALLAALAGGIGLTARLRREGLLTLGPRVAATEAAVRRRGFSPEQRAALIERLRPIPKTPIGLTVVHGDDEARGFIEQIRAIFNEAGFPTAAINVSLSSGRSPPLLLFVHDKETAPACAATLQTALIEYGFDTPAEARDGVPQGTLSINVGPKGAPSQ